MHTDTDEKVKFDNVADYEDLDASATRILKAAIKVRRPEKFADADGFLLSMVRATGWVIGFGGLYTEDDDLAQKLDIYIGALRKAAVDPMNGAEAEEFADEALGRLRSMRERTPKDPALVRAFENSGGQTTLAKKLGVSPQAVSNWRRCPTQHVLRIARISGVPCEELRPDLYIDGEFIYRQGGHS